MEQSRDPMDKNRIMRLVRPDERAGNREVHTIKGRGSKFGGDAAKAVELTSGDLRRVPQSGLAGPQELAPAEAGGRRPRHRSQQRA